MIQVNTVDNSIHIFPKGTDISINMASCIISSPESEYRFILPSDKIKSIMEEGVIIWPKR